jgi:hypothetical protein
MPLRKTHTATPHTKPVSPISPSDHTKGPHTRRSHPPRYLRSSSPLPQHPHDSALMYTGAQQRTADTHTVNYALCCAAYTAALHPPKDTHTHTHNAPSPCYTAQPQHSHTHSSHNATCHAGPCQLQADFSTRNSSLAAGSCKPDPSIFPPRTCLHPSMRPEHTTPPRLLPRSTQTHTTHLLQAH